MNSYSPVPLLLPPAPSHLRLIVASNARAATVTPAPSTRDVDGAGEQQHFFFVMIVFDGTVSCCGLTKIVHADKARDAPEIHQRRTRRLPMV